MELKEAIKILEEKFIPTSELLKKAIHCGIACMKERLQREDAEKWREDLFRAMHKMLEAHLIITDAYRNAPEVLEDFQTNVIGLLDEHIKVVGEEDQMIEKYQKLGTVEEIAGELEMLASYRKIYGTAIEKRG